MKRRRWLDALLSVALMAATRHAHAQGDDDSFGPPRPTPPATTPTPPSEEEPPAPDEPRPPITSPPPLPDEARTPRFGTPGVFLVTTGIDVGISTATYASSEASSSSFRFSPGFDYFFASHLSLGLDVNANYGVNRGYGADGSLVETTQTLLSAGPRFGVDLPLGRFVSFYPRFTLGIESTHSERQVIHGKSASVATAFVASPSNTQTGPWVALFAPLLLHPAPHVVVGAGPSFFHEFGRVAGAQDVGGERTTLGGRITIGAWWGGAVASPEEAAPATTPAATEPRFGDARHFVLDGLAGAGFTYSFHNGTASNTTNVFINPGFDYFVASQVSLGLGVSTDYTKTNGVQPSGAAVTYETTGIGVTPRIGVNIPISAALSFYPRATLFAGTRSYDESSGASGINYSVYIVNLGIYAPLLVHVASHAFIGIGPYVNHDLTAKLANGLVGPENLATRAGASVLVGGWL